MVSSLPDEFILADRGGERRLMDSLPTFTTRRGGICFHADALGRPSKGGAVTCLRCRRTYVAKKRRPRRTGGDTCFECGHHTPKGPKQPKRWVWVELIEPAVAEMPLAVMT